MLLLVCAQYLNGELAKKTDEIVSLEERVLKLEEENDLTIREHEQKMLAQKDAAEQERRPAARPPLPLYHQSRLAIEFAYTAIATTILSRPPSATRVAHSTRLSPLLALAGDGEAAGADHRVQGAAREGEHIHRAQGESRDAARREKAGARGRGEGARDARLRPRAEARPGEGSGASHAAVQPWEER